LTHGQQGTMQARFDGAERNSEHTGDIRQVLLSEEAQREDVLLVGR
jgi:hypothetical protein